MKTIKKNIKILTPYPLIMEIIRKIINKEDVTVRLKIDIYKPYKICVEYKMEEEPFYTLQDVCFVDKDLFWKYMVYLKSCETKGISIIWKAYVTDFKNKDLSGCNFELTIPLIWEEQEDEIKEAETEAQKIIRSARGKAVNERRRIIEKVEEDLKKMYLETLEKIEKEKEDLNKMSSRLDMFLSAMSKREYISKEEALHSMLKFMTLYTNEDITTYESEKGYRTRIKHIKEDIHFYQKNKDFDMRIDWDSSKRPENLSYDAWRKIGKMLIDYYDDVSSLYTELRPKLGTKTTLTKIIDCKFSVNDVLYEYGFKIKEEYASLWEKLIEINSELERFKRLKKEEEREEKERKREEEKARKEWENERRNAEKEEAAAQRKLEEAQKELQKQQKNEQEYDRLKKRIAELEEAYQKAIQRRERAISMAEQTKRGFVYIISNVNSFGENIFKIGLTRRLDPTERVDELGNASVPFPFNINAIIESDDAPALEASLHRRFEEQKINKKNWRKEFFRVTFDEIEKALKEKGIEVPIIKKYFD